MANGHGGKRQGAGRKSKSEEQSLVDQLKAYDVEANKQLVKAMKAGASWAIKLFYEYRYGKPRQTMDVTSDGRSINPAIILFTDGGDEEE